MAGSIVYAGGVAIQGNNVTFNFTDVPAGTPAADRHLVIVAGGLDTGGAAGAGVTGVTVNGAAATPLANLTEHDGSRCNAVSGWIVPLPAGADVDIAVTFTRTFFSCHLHTYAVYGIDPTVVDSDSDFLFVGGSVTGLSFSLDVPAGGVAIGGAFSWSNGSQHTWSVLAEGGDDVTTFSGAHRVSAASLASASPQEPLAASVAFTPNENEAIGFAVSLAPSAAAFQAAWAGGANQVVL